MEKIDFKKEFSELYAPKRGSFSQVKIPKMRFFMVDGKGDPNTSEDYVKAIQVLYSVSYTLKFMSKKQLDKDYGVPPLEGLWWAKNMKVFESGNKDQWLWTMMIMIPDHVPTKLVETAIATAQDKKTELDFSKLRVEAFTEGLSVQIMYVGAYKDEAPVIHELHNGYLPANGLIPNGKHHEIYLSDPRKTAASKLKTIIRQPVKKGS
ncbi:MAG: GyrI-like domain-containing protein [Actinobacteria bacterium]|nr:GyrI-like domain-containing protein [Actinomycetota bacterium]